MTTPTSSTNPNPFGPTRPLNPTQDPTPLPSPHISPVPSRQPSPDPPPNAYFSHSQRKHVNLPQLKDEIEALQNWNPRDRPWRNQTCIFPEPIYTLEGQPEVSQLNFRTAALQALSRWRQIGSYMPRLYPSEEQWNKFLPELRAHLKSAITLLEAKGMEQGIEKTKYFINE